PRQRVARVAGVGRDGIAGPSPRWTLGGPGTTKLAQPLTAEVGHPDMVVAVHGDPPWDREAAARIGSSARRPAVGPKLGDGGAAGWAREHDVWTGHPETARVGDPGIAETVDGDTHRRLDATAAKGRSGQWRAVRGQRDHAIVPVVGNPCIASGIDRDVKRL